MDDPLLGLLLFKEFDKLVTLNIQKPLSGDAHACLYLPATEGAGQRCSYTKIVFADESPLQHVDQQHLAGGDPVSSGHDDLPLGQRCLVTGFGQRPGTANRHVEQFAWMHHDIVPLLAKTHLNGCKRALGDLGLGNRLECCLDNKGEGITASSPLGHAVGLQGKLLAPAPRRNQTNPHFDETNVRLLGKNAVRCMHDELAPTTKRHPLDGSDNRHRCMFDPHAGLLEFGDGALEPVKLLSRTRLSHLLEVCPDGKGWFVPDHQGIEITLGPGNRFEQAIEHLIANGVHLALERDDPHAAILVGRRHRRTPSFSHRVSPRSS